MPKLGENSELSNTLQRINQLKSVQIKPPQTSFYYFDKENREKILVGSTCEKAEQAFELLKASFDNITGDEKVKYD